MATQAVTTVRLDKETLLLLDRMARYLRTDRSALIRRAVHQGARKILVDESIARYQRGEISSGAACAAAGISLVEFLEELQSRGLNFLTDEEGMLQELAELSAREKPHGKRRR
jgi:predicted transcriptional regulator